MTTTTITGGANENTYYLSNPSEQKGLDNLAGPVVINGGSSLADLVVLDDSDANYNDTYDITATTVTRNIPFGGLTYDDNIGTLTLYAENTLGTNGNTNINIDGTADFVTTNVYGQGGADTINVNSTGSSATLNITTGSDAGSTINVLADNEPVSVVLGANGAVNIGYTDDGSYMGTNKTMAGILGAISISDPPAYYDLAFDDQNDTTARTWTLDNDDLGNTATVAVSSLATTSYAPGDLNSLTINGGSGGNTFYVNNTTSDLNGNNLPVDTVLNTGIHVDQVNVYATGSNTLDIQGQNGLDSVILGALAGIGMQDLNGTINVDNGSDFTDLTLDDSQDTVGQTALLFNDGTNGQVTGLSPATINYPDTDISSMTVYGGSGGNAFTVNGTTVNGTFVPTVTNLYKGFGAFNTVYVEATNAGTLLNIYGQGNGTDDITLGSGVMGAVNIQELDGGLTNETIDLTDDGFSHAFVLYGNGTTSTLVDADGHYPTTTFHTASLSSLTIQTDPTLAQSLTVDFGGIRAGDGGNPIPYAGGVPGLFFDADGDGTSTGTPAGTHELIVEGKLGTGPFATEVHNAESPSDFGPGHYGDITFNDGQGNVTTSTTGIVYTGLQPLLDTTPALSYTFNDFGYPDQSFEATYPGTLPGGANSIEFTSIPTPATPTNFETTDVSNKVAITFNTPAEFPGLPGNGLFGLVDLPTVYTGIFGLTHLTFNTPTGADNTVKFEATPAGVMTSLNGSTAHDITDVTATGVAAGTTLTLNAGPGVDTLNYDDTGGGVPTITAGPAFGEVLIKIPGAGTVDALYYSQINILNVPTSPPPVISSPPIAVNVPENVAFVNQLVGTFTYPLASLFPAGTTLPTGLPASDFTATINWGDGTATTGGTITQDAVNPDLYYVTGGHTYTTSGMHAISITVTLKATAITGTFNNTPITLDQPTVSAMGTSANANVTEGIITVTAFPVVGTEGLPIPSGVIATFIDSGTPNPAADYSASITITGTGGYSQVIPVPPGGISRVGTTNQYTVTAPTFTLPEEGTYQVAVSVTNTVATPVFTATGYSTATINDAPLTAGPAIVFPPVSAHTQFSGVVGTFTDANPTAPLSDFTAIIDWGDGSAQSAGMISQPGGVGKPFDVSGTHTYLNSGVYTITTYVTDVGGSKVTLTSTIDVNYPDIYLSGNNFLVSLDSTKTDIDITVDGTLNTFVASQVHNIYLYGDSGNDSLTVDSQYGLITAPINFYASAQGTNDLIVQQSGAAGPTLTRETIGVGATYGTGSDTLTDGTNTETIAFFNLNPMFLTAPVTTLAIAPIVGASLLDGNNAINYSGGSSPSGPSPTWGDVTVDNFEPINFTNADNLAIDAGSGSDEINLNNLNPVRPTGQTAGGLKSISVDGGDPTASDTLVVNGVAGTADDFMVQPTGVGAGTVNDTPAAFVPVTFAGIESLVVVGQAADGDALRVGDTANADTVTYTPGATADAGSITGYSSSTATPNTSFAYTPLTFSGITGFVVPISSIGAQAGNDTLIVNGTAANDTFNFTGSSSTSYPTYSSVTVDGYAPVFFSPTTLATNGVILRGLGGANTYNFTAGTSENAPSLAVPIHVQGNGSGDILNFTAITDVSTTFDYGTSTLSSTTANSIAVTGVGTINVAANAGSLVIDGTSGDDNFVYTPSSTAANAGMVSLASSPTVVKVAGLGIPFGTLTIDPLGSGANSVTVMGPAGAAGIEAAGGATPTVTIGTSQPLTLVPAHTQSLIIDGGLGSDALTVNSTAGAFAIPITYHGGSGASNSLVLKGGTATSDTYTASSTAGSGSSVLVIGGVTETVNFTGLSPVFDSVVGPLVVNANNANNAITYQQGDTPAMVPSAAWGQVAVDASEPINFTAKTTLTINGLAGADVINLNDPATPTGLTAITIAGGVPSGGDTLIVNGTSGTADNFVVIPTGAGAGTVSDTSAGVVGVTFSGIENLVIAGQTADADSLRVGDTSGNDVVRYTPGASIDGGMIAGISANGLGSQFSYTPITFSGISSYVMPISTDGPESGNDELVINGESNTANTFTFTGAGVLPFSTMPSITVNGHTPVFASSTTLGTNGIVLNGVGSTNTFNFIASTAQAAGSVTTPIAVNGSGQSTINFTANPGATTVVNYGAGTLTSTGANPITFLGVGTINLNTNGGTLLVDGTAGDDSLTYTPATASAGSISLDSKPAPIINFTGAAAGGLTIDPLGGNNSVSVVGTTSSDMIVATAGATPTVQVNGLEMLKLVAANTQSLSILAGLGDDNLKVDSTAGAFTIPITYDGGGGSNSLTLLGGTATSDTYTASTTAGAGSSVLVIGGVTETVNFLNLTPVFDSVAGPLVVDANNASNAITYQKGDTPAMVPSNAWGQVAVDASEPINFTGKTTLTINGLGGTDTISLGDPATPTGLTAITVNGSNPTASDTLVVNGAAGTADSFVVIPTGIGAGTVSDTGAPGVTFAGIGSLSIVGQAADADSLRVGDTSGNDVVQYTPGVSIDGGTIGGTSAGGPSGQFGYTPITFSGISSYVMPISTDGPQLGNDELVVNGSATTANTFTFTGAGVAPFSTMPSIVVNGHAPVFASPATLATKGIVFNAAGTGNVFNFVASTAEGPASLILPVAVNGDGQSTINFTANPGASTVVNYGASTITSTGANTVSFSGVGTINVNTNGGTLLVDGTAGDDSLTYTPSGVAAGAISLDNKPAAPIINFTGAAVGGLTIDPLGGSNSITVVGTTSSDMIVATAGATPTVQVNSLEMLKLVAINTQSLSINGGLGDDSLKVDSTAGAFTIPITYDGGGGSNSLTLIGGSALSDVYTATAGGSGSSVLTFAGPAVETVNFTNLCAGLRLRDGDHAHRQRR